MKTVIKRFCCLLTLGCVSPALAQSPVGQQVLATADGQKTCLLTLKDEKNRLELAEGCVGQFPRLAKASYWKASSGTMELLDAARRPLMKLSEVESGLYETRIEGEGILFLQSQATAQAIGDLKPETLFGDWILQQGQQRLCGLTLMSETSEKGLYEVKIKPDCSLRITGLNLQKWRVSGRKIELLGLSVPTLVFEEAEEGEWRTSGQPEERFSLIKP